MKTKNVVLTLAAVIVASAFTFASEPTSKVAVVKQNNTGIFKVIYAGASAGKVTLKVYDSQGNQLLSETTNGLDKFMRPVNFNGMDEGEYVVEITDATGTQIQKINYQIESAATAEKSATKAPVNTIHITKLQDRKYLLSVATEGNSSIDVNIYDGNGNLIHEETRTVNGKLGLVYNLAQVDSQPTFRVVSSVSKK
jgi:hypothetical protein